MKDVYIIGSKGIPAKYGGFETFVDKLTEKRKSDDINYHVACMSGNNDEFIYNDAKCFNVKVPNIGPAKAVYYDILALKRCIADIKKNKVENAIIYILACRIGPFIGHYKRKLEKIGVKLFLNPDGHEWKRAKWNYFIKKYWKLSEKLMIKHSDFIICDSISIEKYIKTDYEKYNPNTTFIAYGADISEEKSRSSEKFDKWCEENKIKTNEYYLAVGRFVPENNYFTIIKEFMKSSTDKKLVLITNVEKNKYYNELLKNTNFNEDERIIFPGTVYDNELLTQIRENAFAYLHGHSVGGTNPSLLEALATTKLNLLYNVGFNKEVALQGAIYWSLEENSLCAVINDCDSLSQDVINNYSVLAKERITNNYSWDKIVDSYEKVFLYEGKCNE